ncbi:low molecular weight protein-tyrosine-phosphatase [uncultured Maribacter sp.]|uniref:low molecular weight protein-tyrosine-phosphatase n=1 Tax=uncultured Maribacter sp. TaxID=431308 RepID=UPI002617897E|nr:low molecular weight protein-tyrosine-phosphatase [uncultured Maribacter sp.]
MKTKILMVCLGNICRSPLAEGILKSKVNSEQIFVDSAGTAGYHVGNMPDIRSIAVAQKYGIDIHQQKCRKFSFKDFQEFDIIYAMDKSNYKNIIALTSNKKDIAKVKLLLSESNTEITEVPDPYYDKDEGFEHVFQLIDKACNAIAKKIQ